MVQIIAHVLRDLGDFSIVGLALGFPLSLGIAAAARPDGVSVTEETIGTVLRVFLDFPEDSQGRAPIFFFEQLDSL